MPDEFGEDPTTYSCSGCGAEYPYEVYAVDCCSEDLFEEYEDLRTYSCSHCGFQWDSAYDARNCCNDEDPETGVFDVADSLGIDRTLDVSRACADYYLLSHLRHRESVWQAMTLLDELVAELVPQFATYLDMACGGEMRHAARMPCEPEHIAPIFKEGDNGRGLAMQEWLEWKNPVNRLQFAYDSFASGDWGGCYGGEKWADIAQVALMWAKGEVSPELFIDRVWNLQHNGGCALNKIYTIPLGFELVLQSHGNDDFRTLLKYASEPVVRLWDSVALGEHRDDRDSKLKEMDSTKRIQRALKAGAEISELIAGTYDTLKRHNLNQESTWVDLTKGANGFFYGDPLGDWRERVVIADYARRGELAPKLARRQARFTSE